MGLRRRGRELAFQLLFQMDVGGATLPYALKHFHDLEASKGGTREFAEELARGAASKLRELDEAIQERAKNWKMDRFNAVDKALLRVGAYEILHRPDIPAEVSINECVELAKAFGTEESPGFVNGILDQIRRETQPASEGQAPRPKAKPRKTKAAE